MAGKIQAVLFVHVFLGFPALAALTLLQPAGPLEFHGPSFALGVLSVLLVFVTGVYAWMLWTGRVK